MKPLFTPHRPSVQWVVSTLASRGFYVSPARIRQYTQLLPYPLERTARGQQAERRYAPEDIDLLERAVLLKRLGLSNREIAGWLRAPTRDPLLPRVREARQFLQRVTALIDAVEEAPRGQHPTMADPEERASRS